MISDDKDLSCSYCNYSTNDILNFRRHMRTKRHALNSNEYYLDEFNENNETVEDVPNANVYYEEKYSGGQKKKYKDRELTIKEGEIFIIANPEKDQTDSFFIAGPRGCGKSRFCSQYIENYKESFPKNRVILFSKKEKDEPLDKFAPIRIKLDKVINKNLKLKDFKDSLVIFDDVDAITDKNVKSEVFKLYNEIIKDGRSLGVTVIMTNHQITDYQHTREMLNDSAYCVVFPKSGAIAQTSYMLKNYCGLSGKQIKKIMKLNSRYVIVKKTSPMTIIYNKGIYLL